MTLYRETKLSDEEILRSARVHADRAWQDGFYSSAIYVRELADRYEELLLRHAALLKSYRLEGKYK